MHAVLDAWSYKERFGSSIRVQLNWSRFQAESWPVSEKTISSPSDLGNLFLPWYAKQSWHPANYSDLDARPLKVTDVPRAFKHFQRDRKIDIADFASVFRNAGSAEFEFPVFSLGQHGMLVLDGCHRLSGLVLCQVPFVLRAYGIEGPIDSGALPDLRHWPGQLRASCGRSHGLA